MDLPLDCCFGPALGRMSNVLHPGDARQAARLGWDGKPSLYRLVMASESQPDEFEALVVDAIDALPEEFQRVLESVAVVVSELGSQHHAYGHYFGDGVARDGYEDRIVIYRDTLEHDFGHDRALLARQVERTLRHELAHHLGWDEDGVAGLGL
jgi:predicted Zn-dependent protease with MMP-like domain